jgi:hypothetical protein
MISRKLYLKLIQILNFVDNEANKPLDNYNFETTLWSKGYKKAMITVRNFIWQTLNSDD